MTDHRAWTCESPYGCTDPATHLSDLTSGIPSYRCRYHRHGLSKPIPPTTETHR